jgi:O-methyltransferase
MVKRFLRKQLNRLGYEIVRVNKPVQWPSDFETEHQELIEKVSNFTMTSPERIFGLIEAVKYISKFRVQGDVVECGVWKGGSMLTVADVLTKMNDSNRNLYLYDTFEGMSEPTEADVSYNNLSAGELLKTNEKTEENIYWAYSALDAVKKTMALSTYPQNKIHFVKGKVEDTIPSTIPDKIALLRLDTDWYDSTKHELIHLFPRLVSGGVLIIDDYGFWKGARKAVDEYLSENNVQILLNRLDYTGRIAIKL